MCQLNQGLSRVIKLTDVPQNCEKIEKLRLKNWLIDQRYVDKNCHEWAVASEVGAASLCSALCLPILPETWNRDGIGKGWLTVSSDEDANNEAVHTEHTSHDNWNDRFKEQVWLEDGDRDNTDTGLGSTVSSAQVGEHKGGDAAHGAKEEGLVGVAEI